MPEKNELLARLRLLEKDHAPDGWPPVQMRDITTLLDHIDCQAALIDGCVEDWAEIDEHVRDIAKRHLPEAQVEGDSDGVPPLEEVVDMLVALIPKE